MYLQLFSMKGLTLIMTLIQFQYHYCQNDYCSEIIPNDTNTVLGIYYRFQDKNNGQYVIYNGLGFEWQFTIVQYRILMAGNRPPHDVQLIGVNRRYSLLCTEKKSGIKFKTFGVDCIVRAQYNSSLYTSECQNRSESYQSLTTDQFNDKTMFLLPSPLKSFQNRALLMSLDDRKVGRKFEIKNNEFVFLDTPNVSDDIPESFNQISQSFYRNLTGIAHYIFDNETGYILLFNIEGKPRYCFTPEEVLSDECKSADKMKILFEECFPIKTTIVRVIETSSQPNTLPRNYSYPTNKYSYQKIITTMSTKNRYTTAHGTVKRSNTTKRSTTKKGRPTKGIREPESSADTQTLAIIAIIILVLITIALIAAIGLFLYVKLNKKRHKTSGSPKVNPQNKKDLGEPKKGKFGDLDSNLDLAIIVNSVSKESFVLEKSNPSKITNAESKTKPKK